MKLFPYLTEFANKISKGEIEIYNEVGIQFELAIYLRHRLGRLGNKYKIQLERNIGHFNPDKVKCLKKEMDIVVFTPDKKESYCIELKFPTQAQGKCPEQMFSAWEDVKFLEQLRKLCFTESYFMMFTDNHLFWGGTSNHGIYKIFRKERRLYGKVGNKRTRKVVHFDGEYRIKWRPLKDSLKYFIIRV